MLSCPRGTFINGYNILTKGVDGRYIEQDINISDYVNGAIGQTNYLVDPQELLGAAGIQPSRTSTQIVYGTFNCGTNVLPMPPVIPEPPCPWQPRNNSELLKPEKQRHKSKYRGHRFSD
jgi:hypothetical protein